MSTQVMRPFDWDFNDAETSQACDWNAGAEQMNKGYLERLNVPWTDPGEYEKAWPVSGDLLARSKNGRIPDEILFPHLGLPIPKFFG